MWRQSVVIVGMLLWISTTVVISHERHASSPHMPAGGFRLEPALKGMMNTALDVPMITEPLEDGQIVHPADVHMETAPFTDPDSSDVHLCSDWEIWTVFPEERIWVTSCIGGVEKVHTHLGDGTFENSHAGRQVLLFDTDYRLRVRHRDNSGDAVTEWSAWAERFFHTSEMTDILPLALKDIVEVPKPQWINAVGEDVILSEAARPPALRIESSTDELLLELRGLDGISNLVLHASPLAEHVPMRVEIDAGDTGQDLVLPETQISFTEDSGASHMIYLRGVHNSLHSLGKLGCPTIIVPRWRGRARMGAHREAPVTSREKNT